MTEHSVRNHFCFLCKVKWIITIVMFAGAWSNSWGQVLDNRDGKAFTDEPFFNVDFIKTNKLKRLTGAFTFKKKGDVLRETIYKQVYDFNRDGQLVSTYETRKDDGSEDTSWVFFVYDDLGNMTTHRKTDQDGFQTVHYQYDSLGRVIHEEHTREIDTTNHEIVRSISFNKERISYANYDRQTKRTRYNNYDLPYLDEFFNYNELGYLIQRIERIKMTSAVYTFDYEYNREGKLAAIRKSSNRKEGYSEELLFKYDDLGNLIEKHIYRDGVFTTDIQIIYNSKSKLLSSVLTRQVSTGFITILRFRDYEFFD